MGGFANRLLYPFVYIGLALFVLTASFQAWCFYQILTLGWLVAEEPNQVTLVIEYTGAIMVLAYAIILAGFATGYLTKRKL